jgi:hypothetical protein
MLREFENVAYFLTNTSDMTELLTSKREPLSTCSSRFLSELIQRQNLEPDKSSQLYHVH